MISDLCDEQNPERTPRHFTLTTSTLCMLYRNGRSTLKRNCIIETVDPPDYPHSPTDTSPYLFDFCRCFQYLAVGLLAFSP